MKNVWAKAKSQKPQINKRVWLYFPGRNPEETIPGRYDGAVWLDDNDYCLIEPEAWTEIPDPPPTKKHVVIENLKVELDFYNDSILERYDIDHIVDYIMQKIMDTDITTGIRSYKFSRVGWDGVYTIKNKEE